VPTQVAQPAADGVVVVIVTVETPVVPVNPVMGAPQATGLALALALQTEDTPNLPLVIPNNQPTKPRLPMDKRLRLVITQLPLVMVNLRKVLIQLKVTHNPRLHKERKWPPTRNPVTQRQLPRNPLTPLPLPQMVTVVIILREGK